jgi:hypothetical protein
LIKIDKNEVYTSGSNEYKQMGCPQVTGKTDKWHLVELEHGHVLGLFSGAFFSGVIMEL